MATSTSRLSYTDCFELMDAAIGNVRGVRVQAEHSAATNLRMRLHTARRIDRSDNQQTYHQDHPLHGRSIYDELAVRIRDGWLYIERVSTKNLKIEPLGEPNGIDQSIDGDSGEAARAVRDEPGESEGEAEARAKALAETFSPKIRRI